MNTLKGSSPSTIIYACDVGSTRTDRMRRAGSWFGWARLAPDASMEGGRSIEHLVSLIADDFADGRSVALGFEAPLFIPVPADAGNLCRGRVGEGQRSFAAPAGLAVTTLGLHQSAWILAALRPAGATVRFTHDHATWPSTDQVLFCWEAFVSEEAHSGSESEDGHIRDAATAVDAFEHAKDRLDMATAIHAERPLSLIAVAALWSGWISDVAELQRESVVIRPTTPYPGQIRLLSRNERSNSENIAHPLDARFGEALRR